MKDFRLLPWLTQLGFSVAAPPAIFTLAALWLQKRFSLGPWILWTGIGAGFYCAADGFCRSLKTIERLCGDSKKTDESTGASFNDHI